MAPEAIATFNANNLSIGAKIQSDVNETFSEQHEPAR